jgi:hypothetical protein
MSPVEPPLDPDRLARIVFAVLAFSMVVAGIALHMVQDALGIPADTARQVSGMFLLAGIADTLVLLFWKRIFKRRR